MSTSPSLDLNSVAPATPESSPAVKADVVEDVLLIVPSMSADAMQTLLATAAEAFAGENILLASPDRAPDEVAANVRVIPLTTPAQHGWVLNAGDYANAGAMARGHDASAIVLLGVDAASISAAKMREMVDAVQRDRCDLVLPRPATAPDEGLVTSALLYPLTRALFGADIHFPLPTDAALSPRMAQRMATVAQRQSQADAFVWPVAEAAAAGFTVREAAADDRRLPRPPREDFNSLFAAVAGSMFADLEARAAFWQRARTFPTANRVTPEASADGTAPSPEVQSLVDGFRLAYANLQEIWSLVLPPQTLLALKRLSLAPAETFSIAPNLWARIVYDFALGFRLRSINRGHLLGAFTPLYMAWVASHLRSVELDGKLMPLLSAETAAAFEQEKPYLVSRWRWPDRFNP